MPDNTELNPGSGGDEVRTDELTSGPNTGIKVQVIKLGVGDDGAEDHLVHGGAPLPAKSSANSSGLGIHSVNTGSTQVVPARTHRQYVLLINRSTVRTVTYNLGAAAIIGTHPTLVPGDSITLHTQEEVQVITTAGTASLEYVDLYNA